MISCYIPEFVNIAAYSSISNNHSCLQVLFFFSSRRRHTRWPRDWSSDVCSSDLNEANELAAGEVITLDIEKARQAGVVVDQALTDPYIDAIEEIIDVEAVRGSGLEVVVDAMYGTSELTLGTILSDMRVPAEFMHSDHNPLFGGVAPAPDAERMSALIGKIKSGEGRYSLGMATDGDSDRIGIVDELGNYVQTNDLLLLVYWYLHEVRGEVGGVVRNVSTTHMLDRLARHFGEEYRECRVGFKYVTAAMDEIGAILGGESSGG